MHWKAQRMPRPLIFSTNMMHEVRHSCSTSSRVHILKPTPSGKWWNRAIQHFQRRKKIKECVFISENHTTVLWYEMFLWLPCLEGQEWTMTATLKHYARSFGSQPPRVPLREWCDNAECRVPLSAQEGGQLTDREYTFFFKGERRLLTNMATTL